MITVHNEEEFINACKAPGAELLLECDIHLPDFQIRPDIKWLYLEASSPRVLECCSYSGCNSTLSLKNIHLKTDPSAAFGFFMNSIEERACALLVEGENEISGNFWQKGNVAYIKGGGTLRLNCRFIYIDVNKLDVQCRELDASSSQAGFWVRKSNAVLQISNCAFSAVGAPRQAGIELGGYNGPQGARLEAQDAVITAIGGVGAPGIGVSTNSVGQVVLRRCNVTATGGNGEKNGSTWSAPGAGIGGAGETEERQAPTNCLSLQAVDSTITAQGGSAAGDSQGSAAGIGSGGGMRWNAGNIQQLYFENCTVVAAPGQGVVTGASIGGGASIEGQGGSLFTLTAKSSHFQLKPGTDAPVDAAGAGIGGGASKNENGGHVMDLCFDECNLTFTGGCRMIAGGQSALAQPGQLVKMSGNQLEIRAEIESS